MEEVEMVEIWVDTDTRAGRMKVKWTVPEPVAAHIQMMESVCENNADALAFYDDRGRRIAELEGLIPFVEKILEHHNGSLDGCDIEEYAVECGILQLREVTEPCGESCECAYLTDFPTECYFLTDKYKALRGEGKDEN